MYAIGRNNDADLASTSIAAPAPVPTVTGPGDEDRLVAEERRESRPGTSSRHSANVKRLEHSLLANIHQTRAILYQSVAGR